MDIISQHIVKVTITSFSNVLPFSICKEKLSPNENEIFVRSFKRLKIISKYHKAELLVKVKRSLKLNIANCLFHIRGNLSWNQSLELALAIYIRCIYPFLWGNR